MLILNPFIFNKFSGNAINSLYEHIYPKVLMFNGFSYPCLREKQNKVVRYMILGKTRKNLNLLNVNQRKVHPLVEI